MRIQSKIPLAVISACFLIAVANSGWAASIGGSFLGRGASPANILTPTESAGVVAQAYWNNIDSGDPVLNGPSVAQLDDAGNFTAVKIIYDASDSWNSDGGTATPNEKLMKGIIKANPNPDLAPINNTDRMLFVITNLSPAGTYNIIVYAMANGTFARMSVNLGATTYYIEEQNNFTVSGGTFVPASSTTPGSYELGPNYAQFNSVVPAGNGTITITCTKLIEDNGGIPPAQLNDGIGVAGIQIIQVSGPAFPPNTDTTSITANPQGPVFAVDGGTVTFTVGTQGPNQIRWTKNNVLIPGSIGSPYVYTAALADDGAQIRAVVYNNVITNISAPVTLFVDPNTPPTLTQGFLKVDRWEGIGGDVGSAGIVALKAAMAGAPTTSYFVVGANAPQTSPAIDNFGARLSGWVKPNVTGEYDFFLRSDDSSELYLNSVNPGSGTNTLPNVNTDTPICVQDTAAAPFIEPPSPATTATPIHLEAGKLYGIVILYKDGTGNDFVQVAWRLTNSPIIAASVLKPIAPFNCWTMASGAGQRVEIATEPVSKTVFEARTASFTFGVTTIPVAGLYGVQWFTNGSVLPGATAATYTTPPTTLSQNNTQFRAIAYTLRGPLTSSIAILNVLPDTNPPVPSVSAITRSDGTVQVGVSFDEAVNQADLIPANFSLIGGTGTITFPTNSYNDYKGILFVTTSLTAGNTYTGHVANVRDLLGNAISSSGINVAFKVGRAGWDNTGTPKTPGQLVIPVGPDGFDILNGGRGEWGTYDESTIAYVKKTNDFDVKVQVVYAEPASQWTRVGLTARNSLNVGEPVEDRNIATGTASAYAQTHVNPNQTIASAGRWSLAEPIQPANQTPNNGHEQNTRLATGAATTGWGTGVTGIPVYPDVWLRLRRSGTTIEGFRGEDGVNWTSQGTVPSLGTQQADMFVGPQLCVETANMWAAADYDVWAITFDPKYDRLFVAQFRNFGNTFPPSLSVSRSGGNVIVTYTGVLQSSTLVIGPYTDVSGAASPYSTPATDSARFFRARGDFP